MPTACAQYSAIDNAAQSHFQRFVPLVLVLAVTLFTFLPLVRFGFVRWDDFDTIVRDPRMVTSASSLRLIWTRPYMGLYVPLTSTIWWLLRAISSQPNPHLFHALNLLIHLSCAATVWLVLDQLLRNRWAAAAGALLFAVHPVQVETVAWISATKDLLCGLLVMVALWQWMLFAKGGFERRNRARYWTATVCFMLALLAKPTAIICPILAPGACVFRLRITHCTRHALAVGLVCADDSLCDLDEHHSGTALCSSAAAALAACRGRGCHRFLCE